MATSNYTYRGTYDNTELDRIKTLLSSQRESFIEEEKKSDTTDGKIKMYFLILVGISAIVIVTKFIKK